MLPKYFSNPNWIVFDTENHSDAVSMICLRPFHREVMIEWKSGAISDHTGVRRRDMLLLLNKCVSFGKWVNTCVL